MIRFIRITQVAIVVLIAATPARSQNVDWLLDPARAGKATIGMTVDALYDAFGRDHVRLIDLASEGMFTPAVQVHDPSTPGATLLVARIFQLCGSFRVDAIMVHSPRYRTSEGIGVGSTIADVRRRYPDARLNREEGPSLIVESRKMTFAVEDSRFADTAHVQKVWMWSPMPDSISTRCRQP